MSMTLARPSVEASSERFLGRLSSASDADGPGSFGTAVITVVA